MFEHLNGFLKRLRIGGDDDRTLFFASRLKAERIAELCENVQYKYRERIYSPAITVWMFLCQVIGDDHSCRKAVAKNNVCRGAAGKTSADPETGSYCEARKRLPEKLFSESVREIGYNVSQIAKADWKWHGFNVKLIDGTTVTMPDTINNQKEYPQSSSQVKGGGFPIARLLTVFCLATGALLELVIGQYAGKLTGETSMVRDVLSSFFRGDLVLADRLFSSYWMFAYAQRGGFDLVTRANATRKINFIERPGQLRADQIAQYKKPTRPKWMSLEEYALFPRIISVRHVRFEVTIPGFRTKWVTLATSLLDGELYWVEDLSILYRKRWQVELNLRSIKTQMQMDQLRCKTPSMVRKEIYTHFLAYNLIREAMVESALLCDKRPEQISFKGAKQTLEEFMEAVRLDADNLENLYVLTLRNIAEHQVGDRPNRIEPRKVKRPPKKYQRLREPRYDARKRMTG